MFQSITKISAANSTVAVAAAALVAGMAVFLLPAAPDAKAAVQVSASPLAKADRLPVVIKQIDCSLTSWPNYEPGCQFDLRAPSRETRAVRIIALR